MSAAAMAAQWGLSADMRLALRLMAQSGDAGIGQAARVPRSVLVALEVRGCAKHRVGPADVPGSWRYIITSDGLEVAAALPCEGDTAR